MSTVITVENLSKKYTIGHQKRGEYQTFRDAMSNGVKSIYQLLRHPLSPNPEKIETEEFWALKDINFEVKQGDRIGIIGRNGAGKSTLLKILSRITHPTTGRLHIRGRIASLLEVGTGFHPELTGRENIFLNGAILGMTKNDIKLRFDEIVAFAEIEKFLDTPVKRYSSGMYVRLAFAVAAHLEPEILIVDEVLAVGDARFQKKCLGKMQEVGQEGQTVLFVSHNMGAVRNLCDRAIMLENGSLQVDSEVRVAVDQYLSSEKQNGNVGEVQWEENNAPSCDEIILRSIRLFGPKNKVYSIYNATKPIDVEIQFLVKKPLCGMRVVLTLLTSDGVIAFASTNHFITGSIELKPGIYNTLCRIPADLLNNAEYAVNVHFGIPGTKVLIQGKEYLTFKVEGAGEHGSYYSERWPGVFSPKLDWDISII